MQIGIIGLGIVLLCGSATALAGPIGFLGLVIPHAVRSLTGPDYRWVLPFSMISAPILLIIADVIGRVVLLPGEVLAGIMTALVGAPAEVGGQLVEPARRRGARGAHPLAVEHDQPRDLVEPGLRGRPGEGVEQQGGAEPLADVAADARHEAHVERQRDCLRSLRPRDAHLQDLRRPGRGGLTHRPAQRPRPLGFPAGLVARRQPDRLHEPPARHVRA